MGYENEEAEAQREQSECAAMADSIDGYEMGKPIGKGAFSNVYEAVCLRTGRKVAIKMVSVSCASYSSRLCVPFSSANCR